MPDLSPEHVALVARLGDALGEAAVPVTLAGEARRVVAGLRSVFDAAACSFARVEAGGEALRFTAADGIGAAEIVGVELPIGRGIAGWVAMSGEAVQISDVATDTRFARDVAEATSYVPTTILAAPVVDAAGETLGVVEVLDPQRRGPDSGFDLAIVELVAAQLASVVDLSGRFEHLGSGLIRLLADPDASEAFDGVPVAGAAEEGAALSEVAHAFRTLAASGPRAAHLAARVLAEVAAYAAPPARGPRR